MINPFILGRCISILIHIQGELKQAKQQSQDLRQTDEFLAAILKPGYVEKERATKPSPLESSGPRQLNGRPKMPRVDSFSRFSEPPAPPPSQPLPEKPDAFSPLKRSDTEKPKSASTSSPVARDSSQILNLIEALSTARKEIDTQGARVKELEELLRQERLARESAEERVKNLEMRSALDDMSAKSAKETGASPGHEPKIKQDGQDEEIVAKPNGSILPSEISKTPDAEQSESSAEVTTSQMQRRLDTMMEQMEEMRKQMASFKERAEKAEDESSETRKSLAEMIETLRKERAEKGQVSATAPDSKPESHGLDPLKTISGHPVVTENGAAELKVGGSPAQQFEKSKDLDAAATAFVKQWHRRKFMEEASPYASMFGVVLLGVGLMAYLNGWQKLDK